MCAWDSTPAVNSVSVLYRTVNADRHTGKKPQNNQPTKAVFFHTVFIPCTITVCPLPGRRYLYRNCAHCFVLLKKRLVLTRCVAWQLPERLLSTLFQILSLSAYLSLLFCLFFESYLILQYCTVQCTVMCCTVFSFFLFFFFRLQCETRCRSILPGRTERNQRRPGRHVGTAWQLPVTWWPEGPLHHGCVPGFRRQRLPGTEFLLWQVSHVYLDK